MELAKVKERLCGVNVVMVTPFRKDGSLDEEAIRRHARFLIDRGIVEGSGVLIPGGSTGECFSMTLEERKKLAQIVVEESAGRVPVFPGCNHSGTRLVIELAQHAQNIGADGVMVICPYYWPPSPEATIQHYKELAEAVDIGIMIYNNPTVSKFDLSVNTMKKLAEIENVVALKECTESLSKFGWMVRALGDMVVMFNGKGSRFEPSASIMGTKGFSSSEANFVPKLTVDIYQAASRGDFGKVEETCSRLRPYLDLLVEYCSSAGWAQLASFVKEAMNIMGLPGGAVRTPTLPVGSEYRKRLESVLNAGGFLT